MQEKDRRFVFTPENLEKASNIVAKYPTSRERSAILPLLDLAQRQSEGWLPQYVIEYVAEYLKMPYIRVLEIASFYSMFNLKPVGRYHIQLCGTTPCLLRGADEIAKICKTKLQIDFGQTTEDGKFTLSEVECLGACVCAPVVQINDDYYENLTPESFEKIIDELKKNKLSNLN